MKEWDVAEKCRGKVKKQKQTEWGDGTPTARGEKVDGNDEWPCEEDERAEIVWQAAVTLPGVGENPEAEAGEKDHRSQNRSKRRDARGRPESLMQPGRSEAIEHRSRLGEKPSEN